jgi:hypothetical protein
VFSFDNLDHELLMTALRKHCQDPWILLYVERWLKAPPSPGDEQPDAEGGVARRQGQNRGGVEGCGYAASLGQRKRVAHIPTAEAATSGLILEGQRQARLHLKFNDPWSLPMGPSSRH